MHTPLRERAHLLRSPQVPLDLFCVYLYLLNLFSDFPSHMHAAPSKASFPFLGCVMGLWKAVLKVKGKDPFYYRTWRKLPQKHMGRRGVPQIPSVLDLVGH